MHHEQRINMKSCFKLQISAKEAGQNPPRVVAPTEEEEEEEEEISAKETHKMLKLVYGDAAVTMKMIYKWFQRFRNGREVLQNQKPKRMLKE